jgi:alkylglycerol monooxygenase
METNYIALSVPVFFILIAFELVYSGYKQLRLYRLSDAITNISCGIGQQLTGIIFKTAMFYSYFWLYENIRLASIPVTWYWWIILFIGVDFCYYWFHRLSHEINAIWATHVVHHQSEEYNLTVALRQSWFQGFFSSLFYLPLAIIGFDPLTTVTVIAFNTLYQFWIHTELIKTMGWFEWIFNTPSHHRVHHGTNPEYIDKNHAGTLIIWDRIFGTFQKEEAKVVYGITTPLKSWNPLWANLHYWRDLFIISQQANKFHDKIKVFFATPGWVPNGNFYNQVSFNPNPIKFSIPLNKLETYYVIVQFVIVLAISSLTLFASGSTEFSELLGLIIWCLVSIISIGLYMEQASRKYVLEIVRNFCLPWVIFFSESSLKTYTYLVILISLVSLVLLFVVRQFSKKYIGKFSSLK